MAATYESFRLRREGDKCDMDGSMLQSILNLPRPMCNRTLSLQSYDEEEADIATTVASRMSGDSDIPANEALCEAIKPAEDSPDPIGGNVYKFFAFMQFGSRKHKAAGGESLFAAPETQRDYLLLMIGLGFIIVIQIFAPLAIFATNFVQLLESVDLGAWRHYDFTQWMTVLLAWAFLFCFILNAYIGTSCDLRIMRKVCRMAKVLRHFDQPVCRFWLLADAAINSYVAVSLSICMFAILFQETNAKDVVFDSLSLAFLLNIDDIPSDLGFLGDVWDDSKVGRFYDQLKRRGIFKEVGCSNDEFEGGGTLTLPVSATFPLARSADANSDDEDVDSLMPVAARGLQATTEMLDEEFHRIPKQIYHCTMFILLVLLVLAVPAPFLLASKAKKDTAWDSVLDPAKLAELTRKSSNEV